MGLVDSRPGTFIGYNQNDGAPNISTTEPKHKPSSVTNASERHVARLFDRYDSIFPVGPSRHGMPATTLAMVAIQHGDPTHCGCRSWGVADDFVTWGDIKWDHPTDKTCIVEATNQ